MNPTVQISSDCSIEGLTVTNPQINKPVDCFLGIRFGTAERFERPQMAELWSGKKIATKCGPITPQLRESFDAYNEMLENKPEDSIMDEDCLYLNVWRSSNVEPNEKLPVIVYFNNTFLKIGSQNLFGGEVFCAVNRCILVTVNFRFGSLGFMTSHDGALEGNYALLDQILSLQWVQKYIEHFGGNKSNVTLFGTGAGSVMVNALMVSKLAKGLFHRAICTGGTIIKPEFFMTRAFASELFYFLVKTFFDYPGNKDGKAMKAFLKTVPIQKLVELLPISVNLSLVIDGHVILDDPKLIYEKNRQLKIPLLLGAVSNEGFDYVQPFIGHSGNTIRDEEHFAEIVTLLCKLYTYKSNSEGIQNEMVMRTKSMYNSKNKPKDVLYRMASKMLGDVYTVAPTYRLAEYYARKLSTVYLYELQHQPPFSVGPHWLVMSRGMDVPYIFGDPYMSRISTNWGHHDKSISMNLMKAWGEFMEKGSPSDWKPFTKNNRNVKVFTSNAHVETLYNERMLEFWNDDMANLSHSDQHKVKEEDFNMKQYMALCHCSTTGQKLPI
ncbi:DgyrCDS1999 [Dimorphilus gyrociliatus]|uniref:DgyrCDS1999 n=1 Tax=Dimorphilus gyrociliatus TaxID=2664684 RepID=A0A7I8VC29_9ANNE|nr:DgyrCDS1999 [Dimorphilus gyrociliatus]